MNKKTLLAGAAFVVLGLVTFSILKSPEKGQRTGDGPRPVAKLNTSAFDTLVVTKDGKATTIKRKGEGFEVAAPTQYAADKDAAKDAFEAIETLEFGNVVTDQKAKHADFEVAEGALRVSVQKGDSKVADLFIGKTVGSQTLVRLDGKDEVWQAKGSLKYKFDKDAAAWRDKAIVSFEEGDVRGLEVKAADGSRVVLEKAAKPEAPAGEAGTEPPAAEVGWKVTESSLAIDHLDKSVADGIVSALYSFRANDFADEATAEETGLGSPKLTVSVKLKDDKAATILVGNKKGDDEFFVQKDGNPQVYLVKKWNLERANKRPVEFRDKTICNVPSGDVQEVAVARKSDPFTLVRAGEEWKLAQPKGVTLDSDKATSIAGAFADWKASSFAELGTPAATGLDKPTATVTVTSKVKGAGCSLKVGNATDDKSNYHVQVAGKPDVYLVPQWQVDRVLPKKDDLAKKS